MSGEIERIDSGGISLLRAGTWGKVRPLVLVHGIGSNAAAFSALMGELATTRPVLAWDAPGYGTSAPLPGEWPSGDDYVAALAGLLDRLDIAKVDLLGHSLGAIVAGRFAVRLPQRVGRLILSSPTLGYGTKPGEPLDPGAAARLDGMLAEGAERFAAKRGPQLVHQKDRKDLVAAVIKAMGAVKLPGYLQAVRLLSCGDLMADGRRLTMPTLVTVGAQDPVTTPASCRRLYDAIVEAGARLGHRFEVIDEAGHLATQEQPEATARLVEAFAPPVP